MKSGYTSLVPAVEQAGKILVCLAQGPSFKMRLTDICNHVDIHKSKGYSILNTLQKFGFVQKDPEAKTYSLGPGLISLSRRVLDNLDYQEVVAPFLGTLAKQTKSTALFGVIADGHLFVVAKREGNQDIGITIRLGHRFPITWGAHGKAIVAFLPDVERERIMAGEKLYFHGDVSQLDRDRLQKELAACRRSGFAVDRGELSPGINAVASPVFGSHGKLIGCLFVIGTFPASLIQQYGSMVAESARKISYALGADVEQIYHHVPMDDG
ncbi:MAG: IclR family transcriptional regulator [Deltaproteobacteria bacterium]|nr:IclR family transcriptional regulator [Deltaproteobacteria bacterium]